MKSILVGITGNIGTGKTLLSNFFKENGVPIYSSDNKCKILMNKSNIIRKNIIKFFGIKSYNGKKLNKNFLSKIIFKDINALKILCSIVHPWVKLDFEKWKKNNNYPYIIKESALIFEFENYKEFDLIIILTSYLKIILKRIIKRDKLSKEEIINRLNNQININNIKNIKNISNKIFFIENNSSITKLKKYSISLHKKIIKNIKYGKR
ncbi:dephospho-CoA kinase [Blattabacterium cuenoti]|uniref:dephospho-CoA kinase n=1 Tax=Blattabacterium cuenoti TaxID=1653831 RepID=UPI00163CF487|nr:dephospho-CoA kinase [Blattabacterium cuenoti]